ncbi:MAG: hypothetical protein LQ343_005293 [Gyalolechia ehrenbergii]|nr:MAG: hypothetical protein LQ343_005293 [Gyalolechia ehrenbergii]
MVSLSTEEQDLISQENDRRAYADIRKSGEVVRYGPNRISVNTVTGLQKIHGPKANTRKSPEFYNVFRHFFGSDSTLTTIDAAAHGKKRRLISQALSGKMVRAMEAHILKHVRTFCNCVGKSKLERLAQNADPVHSEWNIAVDVSTWTNRLTFDIMGDMAFGRTFGVLKDGSNRYIPEILARGVHGLYLVGHMPMLLKLKLDTLMFRSLVEGTHKYKEFSQKQFEERMTQGTHCQTRDILATLVEAKDPDTGEALTRSELISESSLLIIAGADTIAMALAATFFYLTHYPATLANLSHEIRSAFSSLEDIRLGPALTSCRYLTAVIDEAMRLSPSIGGLLPREVLPGGLKIENCHFPAGTVIGTAHYAIHHNEAYYPNPFIFKPSRWIDDGDDDKGISKPASILSAKSAFCPFSIGPNRCVGKVMAYAEMKLLLARVLWVYDLRLEQGSALGEGKLGMGRGRERKEEFQAWDWFTGRTRGPSVEFRPRQEQHTLGQSAL